MNNKIFLLCCVLLLALIFAGSSAYAQLPYTQNRNVVYAEIHGVAMVMDVFEPTGKKNGLAIIDVVSGAWHSDRSKLRHHELAQMFRIFCEKGYTVFAIRPGSISKFTVPEMLININLAINYIEKRAGAYQINKQRLGLTGASAGGHLACLTAVQLNAKREKIPVKITPPTGIKAVGVFFPPTDFLNFDGQSIDPRGKEKFSKILRGLAFPTGVDGLSDEQIRQQVIAISPARLVTKNVPPFMFIHGDADRLVPVQQSKLMVDVLKKKGVTADLVIKKGGGHPWLTIHEEVKVLADWFDRQLAGQQNSKAEQPK